MRIPKVAILIPLVVSRVDSDEIGVSRVRGLKGEDPERPPPPTNPLSKTLPMAIGPDVVSSYSGYNLFKANPVHVVGNTQSGMGGSNGKGIVPPPLDPDEGDFPGKGKGGPIPSGKGKGASSPTRKPSSGKGGKGGFTPTRKPNGGKGPPDKPTSKTKKGKQPKMKTYPPIKKTKMQKSPKGPKGKGKGSTPAPTRKGPQHPTYKPSRPPVPGVCRSVFTNYVLASVPEVISYNPKRCCDFKGATAGFVTHALPDPMTSSGFEPFWDNIYDVIDETSSKAGLCFFMTGVDPSIKTGRKLSEVLINVNQVVSGITQVPSMMSTDPTNSTALIQEIRTISSNPGLPSIGVFNSGYENILAEMILSGLPALPFIGVVDNAAFGSEAARATLNLLSNMPPVPVCFNSRLGQVRAFSVRCGAYYAGLSVTAPSPEGTACSAATTINDMLGIISQGNSNALWAPADCCAAAAQAAQQTGRFMVVGCMDEDTAGGLADFVTVQPATLQAYASAIWADYPVLQALRGRDGRSPQFFPSLSSLVNTAPFNEFL